MRFQRMLMFVFPVTVVFSTVTTTVFANEVPRDGELTAESTSSTWLSTNGLSENARQLIKAVSSADQQGLSPESYYQPILENIAKTDGTGFAPDITEKILERAFHKLAHDMAGGIVDPTEVQRQWYREAPKVDTAKLFNFVEQGRITINDALRTVKSTEPGYGRLSAALVKLQQQTKDWTKVTPGESLSLGSDNTRVKLLRERLVQSGDLAAYNLGQSHFDQALHNAVVRFQSRHGLTPDGIVASATLNALNVSLDDRIDQIKLNLERMRWMTRETAETNQTAKIVVNIPDYQLHMYNQGQEIFTLPVVTGKPKHQTPIFSETMKKIVVAPTWIVPTSITNNELIPLEKAKPGYFDKQGIGFYQWSEGRLKPVSKSNVSSDVLNQKPFPYVLQQAAGEDNVLGRIKFLMPNKHSIYLHDTSARSLFSKTDRAFSHGCIRVSSPELLGSVLLQMDGYDQNQTQSLLEKETTTTVNLKTHIPTHLVYYTSWVDNQGTLQFRKDIYKQDKRLNSALKQKEKIRIAQAQKLSQPVLAAALPAASD